MSYILGVKKMYKVKEAADLLGVTRVDVFEILLSQRELFEPYVDKSNSITYISEEGLELLRQMLEKNFKLRETHLEIAQEQAIKIELEQNELQSSQNLTEVILEEEVIEDLILTEDQAVLDDENEVDTFEDLEDLAQDENDLDDDNVSQWLNKIREEDFKASKYDAKLKEQRTYMTQLRNKILGLDSEIKRKDEAIKHYHEIMKDDIRWLEDLELKIQLIVKHEISEINDSEIEPEEDKGNFFKFFKR